MFLELCDINDDVNDDVNAREQRATALEEPPFHLLS